MTSPTPGTGQARSCAECGTRGEPGQSFCDACGAVLGWTGTPARAATGEAPAAAAPATVPAADRTDDPAPAAAPAGAPAGRPAAPGEPGWDAFALPGAGTGTARTGHDGAQDTGRPGTVAAPGTTPAARTDAPPAAEPATAGVVPYTNLQSPGPEHEL
ncbi:zinc ribbon domain-containing protein, partial [Streptomyces scabiei]|nr:zinc ribbon domain-containing protein [Streptomyces scabiei]